MTPRDERAGDEPGAWYRAAQRATQNAAAACFVNLIDTGPLARAQWHRSWTFVRQSPAHVREVLELRKLQKLLQAARLSNQPSTDSSAAVSNVVSLPFTNGAYQDTGSRLNLWRRRSFTLISCVLVLGALVAGLKAYSADTLGAELNEILFERLADGTRIRLLPGSTVNVSLDSDKRTLRLERGDVILDVANDPSKPFWVESYAMRVRAEAAQFRMQQAADRITLWVSRGEVTVYANEVALSNLDSEQERTELSDVPGQLIKAGEQCMVTPSVTTKRSADGSPCDGPEIGAQWVREGENLIRVKVGGAED